jgi:hypothetical protein
MSRLTRRSLLLAPVALVACSGTPAAPPEDGRAPITLVGAFAGQRTGQGHFRVWLTGAERRFTARLAGRVTRMAGRRRLTVVEDFLYDDGQQDRLTWVFDETGPGQWTGRRDDTVGLARVVEEDGLIRLTYTADFRSPAGVTRLGFADVIFGTADGRVVNDAVVSRAGLPVGAVRFVLSSA